jgi:hypothetical protein
MISLRSGVLSAADAPRSSQTTSFIGDWQSIRQAIVERRTYLTAAVVFVVVMIVYLQTIMQGPAFFDTAEYQVAPYVLGNMHQTGYPLYGIVGKIFGTLVPIGSFGYRMNLMASVFLAIMAAMLIFFLFRYDITPPVAFAAALSFAFAQNVWHTAQHADPHPLTALIAASLWLMALRWKDTGDRRWLWATAFLSGLGLGAAAVLVAELPAIIIYTVISQPRRFFYPITMIVAGLLGVIGVVGIYTYLPIRAMMNAPINYWNPQTWERFRDVVLSGGGDLYSWQGLHEAPRVIGIYAPQIYAWYGEWLTPAGRAIVWVLAVIGVIALMRRDWRLAFTVSFGLLFPMYASITVPNAERGRYFIMSNWLLFFLAAVGTQAIFISSLRRIDRGSIRQSLAVLGIGLILLFPCYMAHSLWNSDLHNDHDAEVFIDGVFAAVKPNALILSWWGSSTALWYGRYVEGKRPDVTIMDDSEALPRGWNDLTSAIDLYYGKRPIYTVSWPDEVQRYGRKYRFREVAKLAWFGMNVDEVIGRKDDHSKAAP